MEKYLNGYLASIPKSEYDKIVNYLKSALSDRLQVSEDDFKQLINTLNVERKLTTSGVPINNTDRPSDTINSFFKNVDIDLTYLFKMINLLSTASDNYDNLISSYFSEIDNDLREVELSVREFKSRYSTDNNIIIVEDFKNQENVELYNNETKYLYCDRGTEELLSYASFNFGEADTRVTLNCTKSSDLIHDYSGELKAKLKLLDVRGIPLPTFMGIDKAVDNSLTTYWDCTTISEEPINTGMDRFDDGGAYAKFKIYLPKYSSISEISIMPYCNYPVDICSILVDEVEILDTPISILDNKLINIGGSNGSEIIIILRQKNYIYTTHTSNDKLHEVELLWAEAVEIKQFNYLETEPINYVEKYQKDIETYIDNNVSRRL